MNEPSQWLGRVTVVGCESSLQPADHGVQFKRLAGVTWFGQPFLPLLLFFLSLLALLLLLMLLLTMHFKVGFCFCPALLLYCCCCAGHQRHACPPLLSCRSCLKSGRWNGSISALFPQKRTLSAVCFSCLCRDFALCSAAAAAAAISTLQATNATPATFAQFQKLFKKWQTELFKSLKGCAAGGEYLQKRNALLIMSKMIQAAPADKPPVRVWTDRG